jgi:dephospho-CoA kinase
MLRVGLTGGMACGKSFVAAELARLGCHVVEADALGHEVLMPGGEAYDAAIREFGERIVDADGTISRPRLAALIFGDPEATARLNAIVHPAVRERAQRAFREVAEADPQGIVLYVAAILIEMGGYREMDKVIVVSCPREQQIARALERPHATEADVLARLDRQLPLQEKIKYADYVIDTSGTKEETLSQTKMVFEKLVNDRLVDDRLVNDQLVNDVRRLAK